MKWQHWLVWGLLASGAIGLGACVAPQQTACDGRIAELQATIKKLRAENERLRVVERDSLAYHRNKAQGYLGKLIDCKYLLHLYEKGR